MIFVLDCSIACAWLFEDEQDAEADRILQVMTETSAVVPSLWYLEITNVLTLAVRRGRITQQSSHKAFSLLKALPIVADQYPIDKSIQTTATLAREFSLTSYDAAYLELALRRDLPISSLDKKLLQAARKAGVSIFTGQEL